MSQRIAWSFLNSSLKLSLLGLSLRAEDGYENRARNHGNDRSENSGTHVQFPLVSWGWRRLNAIGLTCRRISEDAARKLW
jgi:hypothetical protein